MAFDPRAYGAQVQSANQAYRARQPMSPAQPQQTLTPAQVQPPANPYSSMMPLPQPGAYARQQAARLGGVQSAPAGYTPGSGAGGLPAKNLLVSGGVPMGQPQTQQTPPWGMGSGSAVFGQGGPQGGSALTGGQPNGSLMNGAYGLPRLPQQPSAPAQPTANPVSQPTFNRPDWMNQFFGAGGPKTPGAAMAQLNGWGMMNPEGVQRWRDAGQIPPANYYNR